MKLVLATALLLLNSSYAKRSGELKGLEAFEDVLREMNPTEQDILESELESMNTSQRMSLRGSIAKMNEKQIEDSVRSAVGREVLHKMSNVLAKVSPEEQKDVLKQLSKMSDQEKADVMTLMEGMDEEEINEGLGEFFEEEQEEEQTSALDRLASVIESYPESQQNDIMSQIEALNSNQKSQLLKDMEDMNEEEVSGAVAKFFAAEAAVEEERAQVSALDRLSVVLQGFDKKERQAIMQNIKSMNKETRASMMDVLEGMSESEMADAVSQFLTVEEEEEEEEEEEVRSEVSFKKHLSNVLQGFPPEQRSIIVDQIKKLSSEEKSQMQSQLKGLSEDEMGTTFAALLAAKLDIEKNQEEEEEEERSSVSSIQRLSSVLKEFPDEDREEIVNQIKSLSESDRKAMLLEMQDMDLDELRLSVSDFLYDDMDRSSKYAQVKAKELTVVDRLSSALEYFTEEEQDEIMGKIKVLSKKEKNIMLSDMEEMSEAEIRKNVSHFLTMEEEEEEDREEDFEEDFEEELEEQEELSAVDRLAKVLESYSDEEQEIVLGQLKSFDEDKRQSVLNKLETLSGDSIQMAVDKLLSSSDYVKEATPSTSEITTKVLSEMAEQDQMVLQEYFNDMTEEQLNEVRNSMDGLNEEQMAAGFQTFLANVRKEARAEDIDIFASAMDHNVREKEAMPTWTKAVSALRGLFE